MKFIVTDLKMKILGVIRDARDEDHACEIAVERFNIKPNQQFYVSEGIPDDEDLSSDGEVLH